MTREQRVTAIYDRYPDMVNSDKDLLIYYLGREGLVLSDEQKRIFKDKCTSPEFITRVARKVRAKYPDKYKVDEKVQEQREEKFREQRHDAVHFYTGDDGLEYAKV